MQWRIFLSLMESGSRATKEFGGCGILLLLQQVYELSFTPSDLIGRALAIPVAKCYISAFGLQLLLFKVSDACLLIYHS
jgi:hypothetical protein